MWSKCQLYQQGILQSDNNDDNDDDNISQSKLSIFIFHFNI